MYMYIALIIIAPLLVLVLKQQSLAERFGGAKRKAPDVEEGTASSSKSKHKFSFGWLPIFSWLRFDKERNVMFCEPCTQAGMKNNFTGDGCDNWRIGTLRSHQESSDHRNIPIAVAAQQQTAQMQEELLAEQKARLKPHLMNALCCALGEVGLTNM